jgi:hypothetical protein
VLRLASLLWRLRRATAIDTGLLETSSESRAAAQLENAAAAGDDNARIGSLENHALLQGRDDKRENDTLNSEIATLPAARL